MNLRQQLRLGALLVAALLVGGGLYLYYTLPGSPVEALQRFHSAREIAEDQIMDPLILAGRKVVPLLIKEVQDKGMERRRYAIAALGHLENLLALPVLESIFSDSSEIDYFRCDALESIALLDAHVAQVIAKDHQIDPVTCISQISTALLNGNLPERRTYLQALVGWHD